MKDTDNIKQLIRLAILSGESLKVFLSSFVRPAIELAELAIPEETLMAKISEEIEKDQFLDPYVQLFDDTFSQEEIEQLIAFYTSPVIKKFTEKNTSLLENIYGGMRQVILNEIYALRKELGLVETIV